MSQDLEEYQGIIEQLKPMIHEPEFNQVLSQVAAALPRQKRFLIKMELKRLARPCTRLIDLRGQVSGDCREYEHEGRTHYLDDIAVEVFERQIRSFGGYTIGVYEAVKNTENNFRVMHRRQQEASDDTEALPKRADHHQAPVYRLGNYAKRREERMNYSISIEIFTELNKSIQASSIDLSVSGLKAKVNKEQVFKVGERVVVQFRGLEGEYTLDKKNGIAYTIVQIDRRRKDQRISLSRADDAPNASFDAFLEKFIHGNKRRYKVNMDNTLEAITVKTHEQFYTPNFTSVPVYIENVDGTYRPRYGLSNDCNKDTMYYWSDEQNELRLGYLFSHERIAHLARQVPGRRETYIFVFNHLKNEKVYFYSASVEELQAAHEMMPVFLGFGARKVSWRVYKMQLCEMHLDQAHLPLSIPDAVSPVVKRQNQPPPPRLLARLKNLSHVALLTDVTDTIGSKVYEKIPIRRDDIAALKMFGHPRNKPPATVNMFRFKYRDQRRESRYQLRTQVVVRAGDVELEGVSEDVSVHGMRIELQSFFHDVENTTVMLSFPVLQEVTQKYELKNLPYQVRGISYERNVLHLQAITNALNTTANRFFDELIKNNRSKLKAYNEEEEIPGIGKALRNIYAQNVMNTAFFVKKDGMDYIPEALATSASDSRLNTMLRFDAEPGHLNLYFLYSTNGTQLDFIQYALKKLQPSSQPIMREIFVAFDPSQTTLQEAVRSRFTDQFADDKERKAFISQAMGAGQFLAIKVFIARTGRPDTESLQSEISYVGMYAIHRAKVLEEQLWSIAGIGDLIDVTDEVLLRYHFNEQHIQANYAPPAHHKVAPGKIEQLLKA